MRTFNVTCPGCDCDLDVEVEDDDLGPDNIHIVTCGVCQTETAYVYDSDLEDLEPYEEDAEEEGDPLLLGNANDDEEEDDEGTK